MSKSQPLNKAAEQLHSVRRLLLIAASGLAVLLAPAATLSAQDDKAPASVRAGDLELVPVGATLRFDTSDREICLDPTVRFKVTNRGTAEIKVGLIAHEWQATDSFGLTMFRDSARRHSAVWDEYILVSGITNLDRGASDGELLFKSSDLTVLSPDQAIDVQVRKQKAHCVPQNDGRFARQHRPDAATIAGQLLVEDLSGNIQKRGFSFSDIPLRVVP